jgi:hypothetical protein
MVFFVLKIDKPSRSIKNQIATHLDGIRELLGCASMSDDKKLITCDRGLFWSF